MGHCKVHIGLAHGCHCWRHRRSRWFRLRRGPWDGDDLFQLGMQAPEALVGQGAQEDILVLEVAVWGGLGNSCPFGKGTQAEDVRAFGFQGLKAQPQECFAQVAVVVGIGGFQQEPPVFGFISLIGIFKL